MNILKTEVDKLDILKLVPVPVDLAKLSKKVQSNQTKNEAELSSLKTSKALKVQSNNSTTYNLKTKVDGIDLTKYVKKIDYDTKVGNLELKLSGKLNTLDFNSNITELENKIKTAENKPDINNLATTAEVTNVKNKIPSTDAFVKTSDYAIEITKIKNEYVTNAALNSQLNDLKSQHIADEVKKVDEVTIITNDRI